MQIINLSKDNNKLWDDFCLRSDSAWFWHTTKWLDYCVSYGSLSHETRNLSYLIKDDSGVLAICPLLLEKKNGPDGNIYFELSTMGSGGYGIGPALRNDLADNRREKIFKMIFEKIDQLAREHGALRASFRDCPLIHNPYSYNMFMKYGYMDNSINTQIIDLTHPLGELWKAIRKGHKYDINRGVKNFEICAYSRGNADKAVFEKYRLLHHKAAGRQTRPRETFDMMFQWLEEGQGLLCGIKKDDRFVGFSYLCLYKEAAFYASASDDPDFETRIPISHVILWKALEWLKKNGYKRYEIGAQQFGPQIYDFPTGKDLDISFFKRGFGGRTVPYFRGVKYYDISFLQKDLGEKMKKYYEDYAEWNLKYGLD